MDNIKIKDIDDEDIKKSYYLIIQSYPDLDEKEYSDIVKEMTKLSNFKMIGTFWSFSNSGKTKQILWMITGSTWIFLKFYTEILRYNYTPPQQKKD